MNTRRSGKRGSWTMSGTHQGNTGGTFIFEFPVDAAHEVTRTFYGGAKTQVLSVCGHRRSRRLQEMGVTDRLDKITEIDGEMCLVLPRIDFLTWTRAELIRVKFPKVKPTDTSVKEKDGFINISAKRYSDGDEDADNENGKTRKIVAAFELEIPTIFQFSILEIVGNDSVISFTRKRGVENGAPML